jgi:hypothetical protein
MTEEDAMDLVLRTSGAFINEDYRWFSSQPVSEWWEPYKQPGWVRMVYADVPCLVMRFDRTGWDLLIGSVPSSRVDHMQRAIGFQLALSGGATDFDIAQVLPFIQVWLDDLGTAWPEGDKLLVSRGKLSRALDEVFPKRFIEQWFAETDVESREGWVALDPQLHQDATPRRISYEAWQERAEQLIQMVSKTVRGARERDGPALPRPQGGNAEQRAKEGTSFGEITSAAARAIFFDRIREMLLKRRPGVALYANPIKPDASVRAVEGLPLQAVLHNPPDIRVLRTRADLAHPQEARRLASRPESPAYPAAFPVESTKSGSGTAASYQAEATPTLADASPDESDHEQQPSSTCSLKEAVAELREIVPKLKSLAQAWSQNQHRLLALLVGLLLLTLATLLAVLLK